MIDKIYYFGNNEARVCNGRSHMSDCSPLLFHNEKY